MTERYQVTFHATDLPNGRYFGTACPYAKVKVRTNDSTGPPAVDLGETEIIMKDLSPTWTKIFFLNFSGATVTNIDVTIYDDRGERKEPKYIGEASFEATSVFQSPGKIQSEQLGRAESSRIFCHIERSVLGSARGYLDLHLRGLDMKNVEPGLFGLGRSDPFFEVAKKEADYDVGQVHWNVVYRSKRIKNNLNPYWAPCRIRLEELCYGNLDWPLKISVFDHNENGRHLLIGEFETTIAELCSQTAVRGNADRDRAIPLNRENKFKTYGLLCVLKAVVTEES